MSRWITLAALIMAAAADRADAIEMFTNFNNGQNIGFPPMEVPIGAYRGFGRGGWNPYAEGAPLRTNPPVPAMWPTGQARSFGGYEQGGTTTSEHADYNAPPQYTAGARRRNRWQSGSTSAPAVINPGQPTPEVQSGDHAEAGQSDDNRRNSEGPAVSVMAPPTIPSGQIRTSDAGTSSRLNSDSDNTAEQPTTTLLRAQPGTAPVLEPSQPTESVQIDE